jgi:hypothetical protein
LHYQNECTTKTFEALNKADPRVPLPKVTKHKMTFTPLAPLPMIKTLKKKQPKKPAKRLPPAQRSSKTPKAPPAKR